jgi:hypothetical protein
MKKGDDKMAGPFKILQVYPRACLVELPAGVKIFPVFHHSLLRPYTTTQALPGQDAINKAESHKLRGRVLERNDETHESEERWEFGNILDCHNEQGLQYLVKWKNHPASWQPAKDLEGQDEVFLRYHAANPNKPGPPRWVKVPLNMRRMDFVFSFLEPLETNGCLERGYCHRTNSVF